MTADLPTAFPTSLLVVRLGAMGDVIHTLPAAAALRSAFPKTKIGWVIEERWAELLCAREAARSGPLNPGRPWVDFVHTVNTKVWRKSPFSLKTRRQMTAVRRELNAEQYELAIDFQGAVKSAILARFAKSTLGMANSREGGARWFYQQRVPVKGTHVIEQYHSLAETAAGVPLAARRAEFPRDDAAGAVITKRLSAVGHDFALINPGAGWGAKQWPAERYGKVAGAISTIGLTPIINFGPGEQELVLQVQQASGGAAQPISCSISELIALTRRARLFIGGDTGPLHLAAALQVPVVAIFGPTDPARNGPYRTKSIVLRSSASKTSLSHTAASDPGLLNITVEEVISAARQLLENTGA